MSNNVTTEIRTLYDGEVQIAPRTVTKAVATGAGVSLDDAINAKQDKLIVNPQTTTSVLSGLTINGTSYAIAGGGGGTVVDVRQNGTSVVTSGIAQVTVPTKTSDIQNDSGFIDNTYHDSTKQNSLSQAQLDAVNSGITAERVASYNEKVKVARNASECLVFYKETIL